MSPLASPQPELLTRQISVAAENIVAAQFALYGFDVLEQASRTRFLFDLGVAKAGGMLKLAVHGSRNGLWDLVDSYLETRPRSLPTPEDYKHAIGLWLEHQSARITCCLVQFDSAELREMPRIYMASPQEVADRLYELVDQLGGPSLCEAYEITDSYGARRLESLPAKWQVSEARIAELMRAPNGEKPLRFGFSGSPECAACAETKPAACVRCLPMMN